jgi:acetyltransferase-like isoleucine patch superfamily enzyme
MSRKTLGGPFAGPWYLSYCTYKEWMWNSSPWSKFMTLIDVKRSITHAWKHRHLLYSYPLLRLAMISPFVGLNAHLHELRGVTLGKEVKIAHDVLFDPMEPESIIIEDDVTISPRVTIYAHSNPTAVMYQYMGPRTVNPVRIKRGTWVGTGALILPGVTIGEYCVIGAGAVVTHDIPDHSLALGVPARPVKKLEKKYNIPKEATVNRVIVLED